MSATNFPGAIDSPTDPISSNTLNSPSHSAQHSFENDAIVALETKVGINSSADTTSMDYKLSGVPASDKAASKTGTESLTNKTLGTGTTISLGSDAQGDLYTRSSGGALQRIAVGSAGQVLGVSAGLPAYIPNPAASNGSTTVNGVYQEATQAQVDAGTTTGSTGADLTIRPDTLRAKQFNSYVVDTGSANAYTIAPTPAITAYAVGQVFVFKAINANTTTSTLAVNGLTATTIKKYAAGALAVLVANDIIANQLVEVIYDATNSCFVMMTPPANSLTALVPNWVDEGTLTWASETADKTFSIVNTGKTMYMMLFEFTGPNSEIDLQVNGDTGSNYTYTSLGTTSITNTTAQSNIKLLGATGGSKNIGGQVLITNGDASNVITMAAQLAVPAAVCMINAYHTSTGALTSITVKVNGGTMVGKAHFYSLSI